MLPDYNDIKQAAGRDPDWYDNNGVPRYAPFHPEMLGVYDHYAVLVEIACQSCGKHFLVGTGFQTHTFLWSQPDPIIWDLERICKNYHYGDPPRHGCIGDTMNCEDLAILEAWQVSDIRKMSDRWERVLKYEGDIGQMEIR